MLRSDMGFRLQSRAKINLCLDVTGRISGGEFDGYHTIDSVFCEIDLADEISFEQTRGGEILLEVTEGEAPGGMDNLIVRALELARRRAGASDGARVNLRKRIPMMAGLGGGSSNAAAALAASERLFGLARGREELALELGSDVPFFVRGGIARARGRGEELEQLVTGLDLHFVVAKPDVGVDTAWAYRELDRARHERMQRAERMADALRGCDPAGVAASVGNDFEKVVFEKFPEIRQLRDRLMELGASAAAMTGSGSAVFGLFESRKRAEAASEQLTGVWSVAASAFRRRQK